VKPTEISVTEAARNFADCVNRAYYQGTTFVLLRNGEPVARLVPEAEKSGLGSQLAEALSQVRLSKEELRAWRADLATARKALKAPEEKWS
jgi:antitoxin (DNA-binding transcriptional repressor) of toxin-antitoxin stability system